MIKFIGNIFSNILEKLNFRIIEVMLFIPFLPIVAFIDYYKIIYIPFAIVLIMRIVALIKKQISVTDAVLGLCIYSVILPDNYLILVFMLILFLILLRRYIINKDYIKLKESIIKYKMLLIVGVIYLILNIFLNSVPIQNLFFEAVYYSGFILVLLIYNMGNFNYTEEIDRTINGVVFIQFIHLLLFIPTRIRFIKAEFIGDWSVGTLGTSEGTILFILYIYALIKFMYQFYKKKDIYYVVFAFLCFIGAMTAVNVALTLFFIMALVVYAIFFLKGRKHKIFIISTALVMMTLFWTVSDPWVRQGIYNTFTNSDYRENRVQKLRSYRNTFVRLPIEDIKYLILGNGMGNYSSRAALTVSGFYVPWFTENSFVRSSYYTSKYVNPSIYAEYGVSQMDTPASQYITMMGEFGIIGFVLFVAFFLRLLKKEDGVNKLGVVFLLFIFLTDNYLEYYKIIFIFFTIYYYIKNTSINCIDK